VAQASAAPALAEEVGATPAEAPSAPPSPPFMADAVDRRLQALESRLALAEQALAEAAATAQQARGSLPSRSSLQRRAHVPAETGSRACATQRTGIPADLCVPV